MKTILTKLTTLVIAVMATLGLKAALVSHEGDTYTIINTSQNADGTYANAGNYNFLNVRGITLTVPAADGLVSGDLLELVSVEFTKASDRTGEATGDSNPPSSLTIDGLTANNDASSTDNVLFPRRRKVVYAYAEGSRPTLTVGVAKGVAFPGNQTMRCVVNASNSDKDVPLIGINNTQYQPLTRLVCVKTGAKAAAKNVIAINFDADGVRKVADAAVVDMLEAGVPGSSMHQVTGGSGSLSALKVYNTEAQKSYASSASLEFTSGGRWNTSLVMPYLSGYLDDGGSGVSVSVRDIPFASYDVVVFMTSDSTETLLSPTVNDKIYSWVDGATTEVSEKARWGVGLAPVPLYGANALKIENQSGDLRITVPTRDSGRGCLAAVLVVDRADATVQKVNYDAESVAISTINTDMSSSSGSFAEITLAPNTTVVCDDEPTFLNKFVVINSSGTITLQGETKPDWISFFDFSNVKGGVKRSWLTMPANDVMGFNFNASACRNGAQSTDNAANDTGLALEIGDWACDQRAQTGSSTAMFADGLSVLTWKSNNVYTENGTCSNFIQGYLDDSAGVFITLSNVPYETYDLIIYCSTDESSKSFTSKVVNGKIYTWDATAGATKEVTAATTWGLASAAAGKAVIGANTLRINGLTGPLAIESRNGNNARGCISAIQIMPAGTSTAPTMTVEGSVSWTDGSKWDTTDAPIAGNVIINATGDVTITVDGAQVELGGITVNGSGKVTFLTANGGTLSASAISTSGTLALGAGIAIDTIPAEVTYLVTTDTLKVSTYGAGNIYTAGAGSEETPVALTLNQVNGKMVLKNGIYYLDQTHSGTATTVDIVDATVYALNDQAEAYGFGVGHGTVNLTGTTALTAAKFVLGQGADGRTSVFTMGDTSKVTVQQSNNVNNNQASIMFGHWNSATTFTIADEAVFSAQETDVLVALTRNNHTINVNGGVMDVKGFKLSTSASGTNVMNLNGGELKLGATGITSYGSTTMTINVNNTTTITTTADEVPVTQPMAGEGAIIKKGSGVLAIGTSRPTLDVQEGSVKLTATTQEQADGQLVLKVADGAAAASKEKVAVVDATGAAIEIKEISEIDEATHTITIMLKTNSFKENTQTSEWTGLDGTVVVSNAGEDSIIVTVDAAFPEGVSQIDVSGKVDIVVNDLEAYGSTILNITEGAIVTIKGPYPFTQIMGSGSLVFDPGSGKTMTVNTNNGQFTGPCTIASGVVKMHGNNRCLGQWNMNRLILVKSGATLDINGVTGGEQAHSYRVTLEEGANFVNNGANIGDRKFIITSGLTLQGDATISAVEGSVIGGACHYNFYQSPINLGTYTLTKTGKGAMYYSSPVISGTGTIDVQAGTFEVAHTWGGEEPTFNDGTLKIAESAGLNLMSYNGNTSFTVKNLVMNGSATFPAESVLTVNGALSGTGTLPRVTLGTDAVLKLDGKGSLTLAGALTLAEGDTLALDLSDIDLTKTTAIPVIKVTDAVNMPAEGTFIGIPAKWNLVKSSDGMSLKLTKPSFTISVR